METIADTTVWLSRQQIADRYDVPVGTVNQWPSRSYGPPHCVIGRHARYRLADVIAWENAQFDGGTA